MWETNMWLIEQYNQKYNQDKQGFMVAMNEFADMVSVAWIAERNGLLNEKISSFSACSFFS